ncbi:hypothetical protein [Aeromicrobium terrae]|uniref:Uncharacterized protein n=1 Tax=Aeromicrobium terrae TaxID=2498846 RepID=A0A5C8NHN8_9ACTN|nr:hypothetical protein [Aeromicrobium terrae]TXL57666.1 hypothetical protein FHP06_12830 [Aeromicrobium terrae]
MTGRLALGAVGVAAAVWGVVMLSDDGTSRLVNVAVWLVGGVVLHDAVLAPTVVLLGVAAAHWLPRSRRSLVAVAFLIWGTVTVGAANVLLDVGGKPDNDSLMNRPYVVSWLVLTGVLVVMVLVASAVAARRRTGRNA